MLAEQINCSPSIPLSSLRERSIRANVHCLCQSSLLIINLCIFAFSALDFLIPQSYENAISFIGDQHLLNHYFL